MRDGLERDAARLAALRPSSHAIRDHGHRGEALGVGDEVLHLGNAREPDHELLSEVAEQEVILIVGTNLTGMGKAVHIDFVVSGFAIGNCRGCCHMRGWHLGLQGGVRVQSICRPEGWKC